MHFGALVCPVGSLSTSNIMKRTFITFIAAVAMLSMCLCACEHENGRNGEEGEEGLVGGFNTAGASNALYSVAPGKQVRFSRGNLRYNPALNVWGFAENQYDFVGKDNKYISETYNNWIDLFGWGTSGWESGAVTYQPWASDEVDTHYWVGGYYANGLFGETEQADWGVYNAIANGGNLAGLWRTMRIGEWEYLLDSNDVRKGKWGFAKIGSDTYGMVILPDEWKLPQGVSFTPSDGTRDNSPLNTYSYDEWATMESGGAIFLPAASIRSGTTVSDDFEGNHRGSYWSASYYYTLECYTLTFDNYYLNEGEGNVTMRTNIKRPRHIGCSVRLVQDKK